MTTPTPFTNHAATYSLNTVGRNSRDNVGRGVWKLEKRLTSCLTSDEMDLSSSGLESTMTVPMQLMDPRFGIRDLDTMTGAHLDGGREGGRDERGGWAGQAKRASSSPSSFSALPPSIHPSVRRDGRLYLGSGDEGKKKELDMNLHFEWTKKRSADRDSRERRSSTASAKSQHQSLPPAPCPSSPVLHLAEHRQFLTSPRPPAISLNGVVWRSVQLR